MFINNIFISKFLEISAKNVGKPPGPREYFDLEQKSWYKY